MLMNNFGFSGIQIVVLAIVAIFVFVPEGHSAAEKVIIKDPNSGQKAKVNKKRELRVRDQANSLDENPQNFVRTFFATGANCSTAFTPPAGKALIIQSVNAYLHRANDANPDTEALLYASGDCSGGLIAAAVTDQAHDTKALTFGSGIALPAGQAVSARGFNNNGTAHLYGYLVPAEFAPQSAATVAVGAAGSGSGTTQARP